MLKKSILLLCVTTNLFAMDTAKLPQGTIQKLNTNYTSPRGTGDAQNIDLSDFGKYSNAQLEVENYNGLLIFSLEDKSFELDISTFGITDAEKINLGNLNFTNKGNKISLSTSIVSADDPEFKMSIRNALINCTRTTHHDDITDDLLAACLKNGTFRMGKTYFKSNKSSFYNMIDESSLGSAMNLEKLKFDISGNRFKGEMKGDITKNTTVKLEGNTWYNPATNEIKIKLTKAKSGIFSVKSTIFKELEKMRSDTLRVEDPYIYIYLEDK